MTETLQFYITDHLQSRTAVLTPVAAVRPSPTPLFMSRQTGIGFDIGIGSDMAYEHLDWYLYRILPEGWTPPPK